MERTSEGEVPPSERFVRWGRNDPLNEIVNWEKSLRANPLPFPVGKKAHFPMTHYQELKLVFGPRS